MFHPPRHEQIIDFGKQNIHVLANAITELTTGTPHVLEPGKKIIPDFPVQADSGFQRLLEHSHEGIQVSRVSMVHFLTEASGALAVKDQQLSQTRGIAECFLVLGDRPASARNRRALSAECIWPQGCINGLLVRLERVFTHTEASMKKSSTALILCVEVLKYAQQGGAIKTRKVGLNLCPSQF
jgi:hypothetical protein